jgi:hypothetical protein
MATYKSIDYQLTLNRWGQGVQKSKQSVHAKATGIQIDEGVCMGLVAEWLLAKKKGTDYWSGIQREPTTPLLGEYRMVEAARELQAAGDWESVYTCLSVSGVKHTDDLDYPQHGVREVANTIAAKVLTETECYFVLSWIGPVKRHATGFYRPWQLIGNSEIAYFYDPNYGEFEVNKNGIILTLTDISHDYNNLVHSACLLRKFKG